MTQMPDTLAKFLDFLGVVAGCAAVAFLVLLALGLLFGPIFLSISDRQIKESLASVEARLQRLKEGVKQMKRAEALGREKWKAEKRAEKQRQKAFRHDCAMSGYPGSGYLGRKDS
jgi:hypothetical protein